MVVFMPGDTTSIALGENGRLSKNFVVVAPAGNGFQSLRSTANLLLCIFEQEGVCPHTARLCRHSTEATRDPGLCSFCFENWPRAFHARAA